MAIEERCTADPVQSPEDWKYSGTLLISGYAGIHPMQADWETPRVVAFLSTDAVGYPLDGGQLSPDERWYAVPIGWVETEPSLNKFWFTQGLRIYNLVEDTILEFRLEDYAEALDYQYFPCCSWSYDVVQWIADDALIFGGLLIRPFDGEVSLAPFFAGKYHFETLVYSPDVERVFGWARTETNKPSIYNPYLREELLASIELVDGISWKRDSSGFIAEHRADANYANEADYLSLYDRDGNFIQRIFDQNEGLVDLDRSVSNRSEYAWSSDDRFFAFNYRKTYSAPTQLFLVDLENKVLIDTCLSPVSQPVWSPNANQLTMLLDSSDTFRVAVFDIDSWSVHVVARHSRDTTMLGNETVLEPDMIGWRASD